jgi:hypothetical protein
VSLWRGSNGYDIATIIPRLIYDDCQALTGGFRIYLLRWNVGDR